METNPLHWGVDEVIQWVGSLDSPLSENTIKVIRKNHIDGATMVYLTTSAICELDGKLAGLEQRALVDAAITLSELVQTFTQNATEDAQKESTAVEHMDENAPLRLLYSGMCTKLGSKYKNWRKRHFRLHSDGVLSYYKSDSPKAAILGGFSLADIRKIRSAWETDWNKLGTDCPKEATPATRIELVSDARTLRFYCGSEEDAAEWTKHIEAVMASFHARKVTKATKAGSKNRARFQANASFRKRMSPVHSGWVYKSGGRVKSWKRRFVLLSRNHAIHYWKDERCLGAPLGTLKLQYCKEVKSGENCEWDVDMPTFATKDHCFEIITDSRSYYFATTEIDECGNVIAATGVDGAVKAVAFCNVDSSEHSALGQYDEISVTAIFLASYGGCHKKYFTVCEPRV
eukprot:m.449435 g.449435  ORF g.449435 m.449435 type:complete len:402 (-) comp21506_c1_seq3:2384-3589(-)